MAKKPVDDREESEAVAESVVAEPVAPVEEWPVGDANPGDEEQLKKLHHHLAAITDVNSLGGVLNAIVSRCKTHRVHPDVIKAAFVNAGFTAKEGGE